MNRTSGLSSALAVGALAVLSACAMPSDHAAGTAGHRVSVTSNQPVSSGMVQQVQARLQQLGMYTGHVDGIWGPATEASVRMYQRSQGMSATGQLDSPTLAAMNLEGSNPPPLASNQTPPPPITPAR